MRIEYFIFLASSFLFFLFFIQKKKNFCIDVVSHNEKHKLLLKDRGKIPLSGSFYFSGIILILFYEYYFYESLFAIFFFILGLMSDLKLAVSPKLRLFFQFFLIFLFIYLSPQIVILTNIDQITNMMNNNYFRVIVGSFFFLVLINGYNFLDGVNLLCALNFIIVLFFLYLLIHVNEDLVLTYKVLLFIISLIIFICLNFFGRVFLGDGGVYGLSFFIGYLLIELSIKNSTMSPYFIANLLWYPAFENLFSIVRRIFLKKKNYLPDNQHLHQILFRFFFNKITFKKKYLLSSLVGITINCYLFATCTLGYFFYSNSIIQIILILFNILVYIILYFKLKKCLD